MTTFPTAELTSKPETLDASTVARIRSRLGELSAGAFSKAVLKPAEIRSLASELLFLADAAHSAKQETE
jgi:hypothetical protein